MTQDEIISIVRQAGFRVGDQFHNACDETAAIRLFGVAAAFGAAKEREACAKVCDGISERANGYHTAMADDRSEEPILYMTGKELGASNCAEAIRARGEA